MRNMRAPQKIMSSYFRLHNQKYDDKVILYLSVGDLNVVDAAARFAVIPQQKSCDILLRGIAVLHCIADRRADNCADCRSDRSCNQQSRQCADYAAAKHIARLSLVILFCVRLQTDYG